MRVDVGAGQSPATPATFGLRGRAVYLNLRIWLVGHVARCVNVLVVREEVLDEVCGHVLVAGHEVPLDVERGLNGRVSEVRGDGLRVYAGGDEQRGEAVARLVQSDWIEGGPMEGAGPPAAHGRV